VTRAGDGMTGDGGLQ